MQTAVIVNGALGKMGALACETLEKHPDFTLVGKLTRGDDLALAIKDTRATVVVDLTRADAAYTNALTIINSSAHPVIGTSGLTTEQVAHLQEISASKKLGGIIAPNFSIGAVLMMKFAAQAARYLPEAEIIEIHHQQKYDAPSGTAAKTAEMMAAARAEQPKHLSSHEAIAGVRGGKHHNVAIHSLRLPGVLARQQVIFGNQGETLTISHDSIDRASFMPGVVLCCLKVLQLDKLLYGMEAIL
ncbi:4-hydroxy-tetrahydrodipicolinate reductase [Legionella dresdenensis]|uniref:4-hydroxy-tetrahydrodipicolinate reductase n=1 Tax=Legionella dresdenensis TaxID=450200 RepID=A0ABV8CDF3_9GAMM